MSGHEYSQGICQDGAAILKDGVPMTPEEIVVELQSEQSARAQGGEVPELVANFRAEIRTERDVCDEYVSFLTFISGGKSHPYLHIPETLDQDVLDEALRRLNTHPHNGEQGGEWVSVDERLPDKTGHYCVALSDPDDVGWSTAVSWTAFWNGDGFEDCDPVEDGQPVTHWMPMPQPPQQGGAE